jgi:hypothetical protein
MTDTDDSLVSWFAGDGFNKDFQISNVGTRIEERFQIK